MGFYSISIKNSIKIFVCLGLKACQEELLVRVATSREEFRHLKSFDYVVVNAKGRLDDAVSRVEAIIDAEKSRVHQRVVRIWWCVWRYGIFRNLCCRNCAILLTHVFLCSVLMFSMMVYCRYLLPVAHILIRFNHRRFNSGIFMQMKILVNPLAVFTRNVVLIYLIMSLHFTWIDYGMIILTIWLIMLLKCSGALWRIVVSVSFELALTLHVYLYLISSRFKIFHNSVW